MCNYRKCDIAFRILPATSKDFCVATGVDEKHRTKTTLLQPEPKKCPFCNRCYKSATIEDCRVSDTQFLMPGSTNQQKNLMKIYLQRVKNETSTNWSGTIVCRGSGTWYPAAIFHEKDLICGFQTVQTLTSIEYGNAHFTEMMGKFSRSSCSSIL